MRVRKSINFNGKEVMTTAEVIGEAVIAGMDCYSVKFHSPNGTEMYGGWVKNQCEIIERTYPGDMNKTRDNQHVGMSLWYDQKKQGWMWTITNSFELGESYRFGPYYMRTSALEDALTKLQIAMEEIAECNELPNTRSKK